MRFLKVSMLASLALICLFSLTQKSAQAQQPPPGAIVLFSNKKSEIASNWVIRGTKTTANWTFTNGAMKTVKNDISSK